MRVVCTRSPCAASRIQSTTSRPATAAALASAVPQAPPPITPMVVNGLDTGAFGREARNRFHQPPGQDAARGAGPALLSADLGHGAFSLSPGLVDRVAH